MLKEKRLFLDSLREQIESSSSFVLVDYGSIGAKDSVLLRRALLPVGEMEVVPKRMFCLALRECGLSFDREALPGHVAAVFTGGALTELIKSLGTHTKVHKGFRILGSFSEGAVYGAEETVAIGKLPSQEVLRAQLLGLFLSVPSQAVRVMNGVACSVLYCMNARSEKREGVG
ncbi:50S ribosomal protein L10 [Candidatus Similichlamydia laticola]|uniref:Large ribosomal subunit protein uL10 n=1 Tax=Candidatus Similichlamydia laticola TaxID=2170265 RepID=A0A369KIU5_9BACT|nr:50S ribosomal protein L10 [Candidatus Similichlamydia laticola]RDB31703.1 LSU ribosomal protein L10p (P0) [Candidatus Similichlamydia laticola]